MSETAGKKRIILIVLAILFIVAIFSCLIYSYILENRIKGAFTEILGVDVDFDYVAFDPIADRVKLQGVSVTNAKGYASKQLAYIDELRAEGRLANDEDSNNGLFLEFLTFDGGYLNADFDPEGKMNVAGVVNKLLNSKRPLSIRTLSWNNGKLRLNIGSHERVMEYRFKLYATNVKVDVNEKIRTKPMTGKWYVELVPLPDNSGIVNIECTTNTLKPDFDASFLMQVRGHNLDYSGIKKLFAEMFGLDLEGGRLYADIDAGASGGKISGEALVEAKNLYVKSIAQKKDEKPQFVFGILNNAIAAYIQRQGGNVRLRFPIGADIEETDKNVRTEIIKLFRTKRGDMLEKLKIPGKH